jgi:large subunit ribosomal protein L23
MNIIKYPLATEKAIRMMESENKLTFVVVNDARKSEIKDEIQKKFNVKITKVNTFTDMKGRKKAYVRLSDETPAIDVATKLGLM